MHPRVTDTNNNTRTPVTWGTGDHADATLLRAFDERFLLHAHYKSWESDKQLERDQFVLKHYAGAVRYTIGGFIDKNNDLLFRDLKVLLLSSPILLLLLLLPLPLLLCRHC